MYRPSKAGGWVWQVSPGKIMGFCHRLLHLDILEACVAMTHFLYFILCNFITSPESKQFACNINSGAYLVIYYHWSTYTHSPDIHCTGLAITMTSKPRWNFLGSAELFEMENLWNYFVNIFFVSIFLFIFIFYFFFIFLFGIHTK